MDQFKGMQMYPSPQSVSTQQSEQYFPFGGPPQQWLLWVKALGSHSLGAEHEDPGGKAHSHNGDIRETMTTKARTSFSSFKIDPKSIG